MRKSQSIVVFMCFATVWMQIWPEKAILTASNTAANDRFGYSVSMANGYALVGANLADPGSVNNAGAAYIFARSGVTWTEQAILTASNKAATNYFGSSVSLTDNYALVGASGASPGSLYNAGAAYIFVRSGSTWTEQATLTASVKAGSASFGRSASLTDNYALLGASGVSSSAGAAYIFVRSDTAWNQQAILTGSNLVANDNFGYSVSLTDNYALIGAIGAVGSPGAAYVFVRSGTTWTEQAILTASNKAANDWFGASVSMTDNYAIVGAYYADLGSLSNAGTAYIFVRSNTTWTQQAILTASDKGDGDRFGVAVSMNENYASVGASYANPSPFGDCGAVYMFIRSGTTWTQEARITASNRGGADLFGYAVSLIDNSVMIGAYQADLDSLSDAGAAYFYQYEATPLHSMSSSPRPVQADVLQYQSTRTGSFGAAVATMNNAMIASSPTCIDQSRCDGGRVAVIKKDLNGNPVVVHMLRGRHRNIDAMFGYSLATSNSWLAITSKGTSYHGAQTALVSIFGKNLNTNAIERVAGLRPKSNNQPNMEFGHSIAVGQFDIIVGVPRYVLGTMTDIGAVMSFRFRTTARRWGRNPVVTTAFDATAGDRFGHSVAFDEAFLAVGNNPSDNTRHAVYILTKRGVKFAHFYKISGNGKRGFGWKVLLSENELIVASPQDDDSGASTNGGCVSVFAKNSTNHFVEYDTIRHKPYVAERRFGFVVARNGDRMAIGTNTCPNGAPCALQGKAYLYTKSGQQWVPLRSFSSGHVDGSDSFGTRVTINEDDVVVGAPGSNNGSGRVYAYTAS